MTLWVVDASVAVKWYVPERFSEQASLLLHAVNAGKVALVAPDLIVAEFGSVLTKKALVGELTREEASEVLHAFLRVPIELVSSASLALAGFLITSAVNCTFYDALYIAAAQASGGRLITADEELARVTSRTPFRDLVASVRDLPQEL